MQFSKKYKANNLNEIIGHKKITNELIKRSNENNNFPDVMFFIGEPGSGKTACASIIAKHLNCLNNNIQNCQCAICKDIDDEKFNRDVHLFNASQMGKDDVNDLENLVSYYPSYDKNIIIIIDEAHELSKSGKGATKKLLEKKRENVYFILCTSDETAFTPEIKRRGQVYLFKEVDSNDIADYLCNILKKENLFDSIDEKFISEGIFTISNNCNGSPGYALSLLERCIYSEIYTEKDIVKELGLVSDNVVTNVLEKLVLKDKSVFADFKDINIEEFYRKSYKILNEAYIYLISGFVDNDWKINNYKRLFNHNQGENFIKLLEIFKNIICIPYMNENSFNYEISFNYFNYENNFRNKSIRRKPVE